jgi:hypothetical protein
MAIRNLHTTSNISKQGEYALFTDNEICKYYEKFPIIDL